MYPKYDPKHIEWLKEVYPENGMAKTTELFNEHFGTNFTVSQIKHRCQKHNIQVNYSTKFNKGHKTWNKGLNLKKDRPDVYALYLERERSHFSEASKKTWFKGAPVGTEKLYHGEWYIKYKNPSMWMTKARYIWQKANRPLEKGEKLLYLNGDKSDCRLENLALVNNKIICRLNRYGLIFKDGELTRCAVTQQQLLQKIKELEEGKE